METIRKDNELIPCPFCGNSSQIHLLEIPSGFKEEAFIQCQLCGAIGPHSDDPVSGWNNRRVFGTY